MKVLLVSRFLPEEQAKHAGGKHVYGILKSLAARHEVHLATRVEEEELPSLEALRPLCHTIHPYVYRTRPDRTLVDNLRLVGSYVGFSRFADRLIRSGDYDIVQVEYVETALLIRRSRTPMVLNAHDVITKPAERRMAHSSGTGRIPSALTYVVTRTVEQQIMKRFDTIFAMSNFDRDYLLRMAPGLKVLTVPVPAGLDISERRYPARDKTILFVGSFKYRRVNVEAALYFHREVLPLVRARIPDARFRIAGYGPPADLTALAERDPQVEVTGFVDDLDRCYKEAAVFVAPILTGGGIIVKVLDALAAGRPVVTTSYGNEGVGAAPGRDLLVADDPISFADHVIRLLTHPDEAQRLGENGRAFVAANYSAQSVMNRIEACYAELTARRSA